MLFSRPSKVNFGFIFFYVFAEYYPTNYNRYWRQFLRSMNSDQTFEVCFEEVHKRPKHNEQDGSHDG